MENGSQCIKIYPLTDSARQTIYSFSSHIYVSIDYISMSAMYVSPSNPPTTYRHSFITIALQPLLANFISVEIFHSPALGSKVSIDLRQVLRLLPNPPTAYIHPFESSQGYATNCYIELISC